MNREELIKALEELKASINKKYSTKYTTDNNLDREIELVVLIV